MQYYSGRVVKSDQTKLDSTKPNKIEAKWYYCIALAWVDVEANFLGKACCKFPFKLSFQFKFY
ncbi:hypothetical protein CK203_086948 [Vitis vinifera]|uniref:Uncharacterized protein n=1 Tax=Vitis vinifera TaxID=29760 RepID=A0A438FIX0_VITVI|nr:hypothetical protein CK203_086948 [Vitis vinifera]